MLSEQLQYCTQRWLTLQLSRKRLQGHQPRDSMSMRVHIYVTGAACIVHGSLLRVARSVDCLTKLPALAPREMTNHVHMKVEQQRTDVCYRMGYRTCTNMTTSNNFSSPASTWQTTRHLCKLSRVCMYRRQFHADHCTDADASWLSASVVPASWTAAATCGTALASVCLPIAVLPLCCEAFAATAGAAEGAAEC